MPRISDYIPNIFHDYLYKNSLFLVLSRLLNAGAGFLFWVIAAKFYSIAEVGKATVLISSLGLIMLFSRFGFDLSIIRYIGITDKNKVFNTSLIITIFFSVFISIIYIFFAGLFQANLTVNFIYGILFVLIAFFNSVALISGNMFLALRKGQCFFIQAIIISMRLFLLLPLSHLGDFGIFLSLGICYVLIDIFSLWALRKEVKINLCILDKAFLKESFHFSIGSYFSNILVEAPLLILPIMVLNLVGKEEAAIYYLAMAFGNLALTVPSALSTSLFIEGSHGQPLKQNITKACTAAFVCLMPMVLIIGLWGRNILGFINKEYIHAYNLMLLIIFASFFAVIYMVYISVQNINMRVDRNIRFNLLRFVLLLGGSAFFIPEYGMIGVGYAWLYTHMILTLVIALNYAKINLMKILGHCQILNSEDRDSVQKNTLTTGPLIRDPSANRLIVLISNTTSLDIEVNVVINDLRGVRKKYSENMLLIQSNFVKSLSLPKPPALYEVVFEGVPPRVYLWTSTSLYSCDSLHQNKFIASNTVRHNDLILVSENEKKQNHRE